MRLTTDILSDNGGTSNIDERCYGLANDGEVEDYKLFISGYDFGDLNASYPVAMTISLEDTSTAKVWAGPTKPSTECTQKFSVDAYGDGLEEDGITTSGGPSGFSYNWVINLRANQAAKTVYYGLWIDWDANANFISGMDAFYSGSAVVTGSANANVSVWYPPGLANSSNFRLIVSPSAVTSGMYNSTTLTNGEVEDYSFLRILSSYTNTLTAVKKYNGNLLQWKNENSSNITGYIIERNADNISWANIGTSSSVNPQLDHSFLDMNPSYGNNFYRLKFTYADNSTRYSNVAVVSDKNASLQVSIFPNPSKDVIHVQLNDPDFKTIEICDITGKKEMSQPLSGLNNTIDVSSLSKGTHIIKLISTTGAEEIRKFVKL